jgi:glutamine synthetase
MTTHDSAGDFERVRLTWTDLNGVSRGVSVPAERYGSVLEEGVGFANSVAEFTLEPGLVADPAYPAEGGDMVASPDDGSVLPLAWDDGVGLAFADLADVSGAEQPLCTRSLLRRVVDDCRDHGLQPMVGVEPEFSVLASPADDYRPFNDRTSYDLDALAQASGLIRDWTGAMEAAGYSVLGVHQESQPGQYELNLAYDDPVTTADGVMFLRHALRAVSRQHDRGVTMMPRPHSGEDANGMHLHLSLWDLAGEQNRFAGTDRRLEFPTGQHPERAGLSAVAVHFVGGLVAHLPGLTAVCNPTVNSYKRLVPGIWAPCNTAWGPDNRSVNLRVPPELGDATRIEFRSPDAAVNPYLALAATLAAGLDGVENEIEPPEPTTGNAYEEDHDRLPRTLPAALDELAADEVLRDALGETLVEQYLQIKREEFDRYQHHVSDWERAEYGDEF